MGCAIFVSAAYGQQSPETVLTEVKDNYDSRSSIQYKMVYKLKCFDCKDTTRIGALGKVVREKDDPVLGSHFWFNTDDSIVRYYNQYNLYVIDHAIKQIYRFKGSEAPTYLTGHTQCRVIKINFINTDKLLQDVLDTANNAELFTEDDHYIVSIKYADSELLKGMEREVWIGMENHTIDKITFQVKWEDQTEFNEWDLSDIEFDKVSVPDLYNYYMDYKQQYGMINR